MSEAGLRHSGMYGCVYGMLAGVYSCLAVRQLSSCPLSLLLWLLLSVVVTIIGPAAPSPLSAIQSAAQKQSDSGQNEGSQPTQNYNPFPDSTTYLAKFGYLPKSDMETGALRTKAEMTKAVKKFQRMAHVPVTGELDELTIKKMSEPRCGVADDIGTYFKVTSRVTRYKRYVLGPSKWPHKNLTYRILNYSYDLSAAQVRDALRRAFRVWSDVTMLTFQEIYQGTADIEIKFARMYHHDGYPFDGPGMTLAHAFFPGPDNGGDVHFDEDETWTTGTTEGVNLFMVAAHEIGHALGLGHSSVLGALMYPWYQGYTPNFKLHSDDLVAIQYLYGARQEPTLPPPRPGTSIIPTAVTPRPTVKPYPTPNIPPAFTTRPPAPSTTPDWGPHRPPDRCTTGIDAAALIRQEVYMFKGLWFWRIDESGVMDGYPVEVNRFWYNLPDYVKHFDAVYERVDDGTIVFFSGSRYWLYSGNHMASDFPSDGKPLTDLGLPKDIDHIDAAFVWGYNLKTYFITGSMYWRYNENEKKMDYDYPRDMSMWEGVQLPVSAAFKSWDGVTYFFKDSNFWRFKDSLMRVEKPEPTALGPVWLECDQLASSHPPVNQAPHHKHNTAIICSIVFTVLMLAFRSHLEN